MRMQGPEVYELSFTPTEFTVLCARGTNHFSGIATNDLPKLYIASIDKKPIYVGLTKQSIRNRLRLGWNAQGEGGYHGYAWRHGNDKATLSVWCHMDAVDRNERDIETVEAEVVFLIRSAGQWPAFQTEIHFHPSTDIHRQVAADVLRHYQL
ncbi:hypothetical protein I6F29_23560 [Bradyrhizobium sp. NBAIM16]|nr:hypothetical protein [Bradyrhizobium sp. NBAIM16]MCA1503750.1 hypothetical protein [Bradyrhizobium sp. NBAIM02]MCA1514589.1 hypothetical protein [Bradyrhizobium sp. NBAIM01]